VEITLKRLALDFMTMLFPTVCGLCGKAITPFESFLCSPCLIQLPRERNYRGIENDTCTRLRGMFPFSEAYSYLRFSKKGQVQKLIHKLKYNRQPKLAFQLGVWFTSEVLFLHQDKFDTIVPVPLHPDKLYTRGYNQSFEIATGVSHVTGHPVVEALERIHKSETQTHLSRWDRFENTSNEFCIAKPDEIRGKSILLIDDIITTGATMSGSASPLIANGASRIIVAAIGLAQKA